MNYPAKKSRQNVLVTVAHARLFSDSGLVEAVMSVILNELSDLQ